MNGIANVIRVLPQEDVGTCSASSELRSIRQLIGVFSAADV